MRIRDRLLAAAEREFAEHGALEATLAQIRSAAGASVGALYHHFPDKADLYRQVWANALADYQDHFWDAVADSVGAEQGITAGVREHLHWVTENRDRARILTAARPRGVRENQGNREFLTVVARWWRTHAAYGAVRDLGLDVVYALWLGPAQEYSRQWLVGDIPTSPLDIADELADAAWRALASTPRPIQTP
ncbi:TetR/AcrR family transcriptional regulator [Nocardia callitridis]|uniref:TetR/AcrR family transcriptional regulator n=1 Tax=Nocardia callitridis TaxID=648753 RepID=A0ABP9K049_9NOCA